MLALRKICLLTLSFVLVLLCCSPINGSNINGNAMQKSEAELSSIASADPSADNDWDEYLSAKLAKHSVRYDGKRGQSWGSDTIVSNTDAALPNAPLLGDGNVGLVLGGSAAGQSINVGMNDFWRGINNDGGGIKLQTVGSMGYNVIKDSNPWEADVDLATMYQSVNASGGVPQRAVNGDYVSTEKGGMGWRTSGRNSWIQLTYAAPITVGRFELWNAGSYNYWAGYDSNTNISRQNTYAFRLQTSTDGRTWNDAFVESANYQPIYARDLNTPVTSKHFRLYINTPNFGLDETVRIARFSMYEHQKNDPNLMPLLVNGGTAGEGIKVNSNNLSHNVIYTSSELYATVCGIQHHLGYYGSSGYGWFTDLYPKDAAITYKFNKAATFKSYQLWNGSASAANAYGRSDWRAWTVEASQDNGATWTQVHEVKPPANSSDPNWEGQPTINSFDIPEENLQYTVNATNIRVTLKSLFGGRGNLAQFKIFAGTLQESGIDSTDSCVFIQNIRDGRIGTESSYKGLSYTADTYMSQTGDGRVISAFTNNTDSELKFRYYTFAHLYENSEETQTAGVSTDGKALFSTRTTQRGGALWTSAATIAATIEGGAAWTNVQVGRGTAWGEFIVPAKSTVNISACVDGRQYAAWNATETGVNHTNITARNSPTKDNAINLALNANCAQISLDSKEWWKQYWLQSYVDVADNVVDRYYYCSMYIIGCGTRENNVPMGLFGPFTTTDQLAWEGCYTTDYNLYGAYLSLAFCNRESLLKPLVRNALESWGETDLGGGGGKKYASNLNGLPLGPFKDKDGSYIFKNGVDGIMSSVRSGPHGYAVDTGSFYGLFFASAYAAIPVLWYYDMTQGTGEFASGITLTKQLEYDYLKDMMLLWEQILFYEDGVYKVKFDAAWEAESNKTSNAFTIAAMHRFTERLIEDAEILGITVEDEPRLAKWADINENMEAYPKANVVAKAHDGKTRLCYSDTAESASQGKVTYNGNTDGNSNPNVVEAQAFPMATLGMYSDPEAKQLMRNTIATIHPWGNINAMPTIFSVAARVGYAEASAQDDIWFEKNNGRETTTLLGQMSKTVSQGIACNNISGLVDPLQLIDQTGGVQGVNDMLLQYDNGVITLYPAYPKNLDAQFVNLQIQGGFLFSSSYDGETRSITSLSVKSRFGGQITIRRPLGVRWKIVDGVGNTVLFSDNTVGNIVGHDAYNALATVTFDTAAGQTYRITSVD